MTQKPAASTAALRKALTEIMENQEQQLAKLHALMKPFEEAGLTRAVGLWSATSEVQLSIANLTLQLKEMP